MAHIERRKLIEYISKQVSGIDTNDNNITIELELRKRIFPVEAIRIYNKYKSEWIYSISSMECHGRQFVLISENEKSIPYWRKKTLILRRDYSINPESIYTINLCTEQIISCPLQPPPISLHRVKHRYSHNWRDIFTIDLTIAEESKNIISPDNFDIKMCKNKEKYKVELEIEFQDLKNITMDTFARLDVLLHDLYYIF
jgi:hypothetical protein